MHDSCRSVVENRGIGNGDKLSLMSKFPKVKSNIVQIPVFYTQLTRAVLEAEGNTQVGLSKLQWTPRTTKRP